MFGLGNLTQKYVRNLCKAVLLVLVFSGSAQANTIVRISTSFGDFSLELFDTVAPVTVQNFLNYVNSGAYNGAHFHRLSKDFVLQGGGFKFVPFRGPIATPTDAPIVNEYKLSNTRGTVAMAKLGTDPNSATSQWFVNLADNSANLDSQNGGFTVFGHVLGDGMQVMDRINALGVYELGSTHAELPLRDFDNLSHLTADNFVTMSAKVVQRYSSALHVFEYHSGILQTTVDGGEELGAYSLNLSLHDDSSDIIFKLNTDSLVALSIKPDDRASFDRGDNRLRIPSLELNNNGVVANIRNVVFVLINAEQWLFKLESYEQ